MVEHRTHMKISGDIPLTTRDDLQPEIITLDINPHCSQKFEEKTRSAKWFAKRFNYFPLLPNLSKTESIHLMGKFANISRNVKCAHDEMEILSCAFEILSIPKNIEGHIVEAGIFKGGSSAKLSILAKILNRKLYLFDSFEGLPENSENHDTSLLGHSITDWFKGGSFKGKLDEVKNNIEAYGESEVCNYVEEYFEDSMPKFTEKIAFAYLDVDLASSTRTCLKYLYPLLSKGGIIISQDGDFPLVVNVFNDDNFWQNEVGIPKPIIEGLGSRKMITITKC